MVSAMIDRRAILDEAVALGLNPTSSAPAPRTMSVGPADPYARVPSEVQLGHHLARPARHAHSDPPRPRLSLIHI